MQLKFDFLLSQGNRTRVRRPSQTLVCRVSPPGLRSRAVAVASMVGFARSHPAPATGGRQELERGGAGGGVGERMGAVGRAAAGKPAPRFSEVFVDI